MIKQELLRQSHIYAPAPNPALLRPFSARFSDIDEW